MSNSKSVKVALSILALSAALLGLGWVFWPWSPPEFLGEADFKGYKVDASGPVTSGGLQATYNGLLTFTNIDRAMVNSLLPANLELAPRKTSKYPDLHPVALMFGDQTDGALVLSQVDTQPSGIHYSEMILAIPFVQAKGKTGAWHTYIVRMYLDNAAAVAAGPAFAYKKVLASVEWKGRDARIWQLVGGDLLTGEFVWGSNWYDASTAMNVLPNFKDMVNIMTTEIVGQKGLLSLCSHFEWDFTNARVAKANTSYTMSKPYRNDMSAWPALSPFKNVKNGAVVVRGMRWRLKPTPILCNF